MDLPAQPREILTKAHQEGARAAEILYTGRNGFDAIVEDQRVIRRAAVSSQRLLVRVFLEDGRTGQHEADSKDWEKSIVRALKRAGDAKPDPLAGPVKGWTISESGGLGIDDKRYLSLSETERMDVIMRAEKEARSVLPQAKTTGFGYSDQRTRRVFANTKGVLVQEWSTLFEVSGTVSVPEKDLSIQGGVKARTFSSVASLPYGTLLAQRVATLSGPTISWDGPVRVMLHPRVSAEIFGLLADQFGEKRIGSRNVFLSKGRGKEGFFDRRIHMVDDGCLPGGLRTQLFDDRGVTSVPLTLLREGVVDHSFISVGGARATEGRATGHSVRGKLRPSNLQIRGGTRSMTALIAEMNEQVFVIDHIRDLGASLNMKNGELDALCSGRICCKGAEPKVLLNARLTGNLVDAFQRLVRLASDTDRYGHVDAPGMALDGFTVSVD
jgi:predicted Zn-dependent protease